MKLYIEFLFLLGKSDEYYTNNMIYFWKNFFFERKIGKIRKIAAKNSIEV